MRYGCAVPLIGGLGVAGKQVTGQDPDFIISYAPFGENEQNAKSYFPNTPHYLLDAPDRGGFKLDAHRDVDFVSALCPCAGLSLLSNGSKEHRASMNYWMIETARFATEELRPKVFWGENASALYTASGTEVREQLKSLAEKNGYGFSLYHTNTMFHGIPQNRKRSFYFFWRDSTAPVFEYYRKPRKNLTDYLAEVQLGQSDHSQADIDAAAERLLTNPHMMFLQEKHHGKGIDHMREFLVKNDMNGTTTASYLVDSGQLEECRDWLKAKGYEKHLKDTERIIRKLSQRKGFWDGSFPIYRGDLTFATLISRTFAAIHPVEDRCLTTRECMHLMGLPPDFELVTRQHNHICQNVPVCTGSDMTREVIKFLEGKATISNANFLMQSNLNQRIERQESNLLKY